MARGYSFISYDERNHIYGIVYEKSREDFTWVIRLAKSINESMEGEYHEEGTEIILQNTNFKLRFEWIPGVGLKAYVLQKPNGFGSREIQDFFQAFFDKLNIQDSQQTLKQINDYIKDDLWCDFWIKNYSGCDLKIVGSTGFGYDYDDPELEVTFEEAAFFICSSEWKTDPSVNTVFSLATDEELTMIAGWPICNYNVVVKIHHDWPWDNNRAFFIACRGISFSSELVTYHSV